MSETKEEKSRIARYRNDYKTLLIPIITGRQTFVLGSRHGAGWALRKFDDQPLRAVVKYRFVKL